MATGKQTVVGRIVEAEAQKRVSDAEVQALSSARLVLLKSWPPARLARLGRDRELTDADLEELQNFIANRTRAPEPRLKRRRAGSGRQSWMRLLGLRGGAFVTVGALVLVVVGIGWMRTPTAYQVLTEETVLVVGDEAQPLERVILQGGTVIRYNPATGNGGARPIRFWIAGSGYRSVIYYPGQS